MRDRDLAACCVLCGSSMHVLLTEHSGTGANELMFCGRCGSSAAVAGAHADQQALLGRHVYPHLPAPAGLRSAQHVLATASDVCVCVPAAAFSPKAVCSCPGNAGAIASCGVCGHQLDQMLEQLP